MRVVLFGLGNYYCLYKSCFKAVEVIALADNDTNKVGTTIDGFNVIAPAEVIDLVFDYIFLLGAPQNIFDMKKQIVSLGMSEEKIADIYDIRRLCQPPKDFSCVQLFTDRFDRYNDYSENKKTIAIVHPTRGQILNGADTCLLQLCAVLIKSYDVHVILARDSTLRERVQECGVDVIIDKYSHIKKWSDIYWRDMYDLLIVNTIDRFNILNQPLEEISLPVVWWLHSVEKTIDAVPLVRLKDMPHDNINVYSVSPLSRDNFKKSLPHWSVQQLLYGVENNTRSCRAERSSGRVIFALVGRWCSGKGHDVLLDAISKLPDVIRGKCEFWFAGYFNKNDSFVQKQMDKIKKISNIKVLGMLNKEQLAEVYEQISVLVCPSRADAMPIVCAEAMMYHHPCIVSENVGTKIFIDDKKSGLICKTGDAVDLCSKIQWCVMNQDKLLEMGDRAYNIYLNNFTMKKFETNVLKIIEDKVNCDFR